jgi:hypothetical protein
MVRMFTFDPSTMTRSNQQQKFPLAPVNCIRIPDGRSLTVSLCTNQSAHAHCTSPAFSSTHRAARAHSFVTLTALTASLMERPGCKLLQCCYVQLNSVHPVRGTILLKIKKHRSAKVPSAVQQLNELQYKWIYPARNERLFVNASWRCQRNSGVWNTS